MANVLRNVVSKQRIRYKEKGFNLDLAYICDNIIAMGYPADNFESMYRNPLGDVYKFLEDNHQDHYKIYNLCLERSYDISKFHGRVSVYPFEDHNPPAIEMILKFCQDVDKWLKADEQNVVAVHCKAGKGRTGTMICCYLVYSGKYETAAEALACYDEKRTKDRKGVTIPSQRRYVKYFSNLVKSDVSYERRTLQFCQIRFSKVNALHSLGITHCSISALQEKVQPLQNFSIDFRKASMLDINNPPLEVSGDIKVEIAKNTKKIFHLWFNTFFVSEASVIEGEGNNMKYIYTLQKAEIDDAHKDKSFPEDFKVELVFTAHENYSKISAGSRPTSDYRSSTQEPSTSQAARSIPQDSSLGSGISSISDQKISASTSGTGSFGVSRSDFSNGYESNMESAQRNNGVVQNINNPHSNNHMTSNEVNESTSILTPSPAELVTLPPKYMEQKHQEQHQTTNKMHTHRNAGGVTDVGVGEGNIDAPCQPSTNLNINNSKNSINNSNNCTNLVNNSYNYNHSNSSSKTSSVSSQSSSSAIGDNEEDWESANTTTIENKTQQKEVDVTNINTLNNISSADVIKAKNNVKESGSNFATAPAVATSPAEVTTIDTLLPALDDEMQYNQQRSKQIKLDLEALQQEEQQTATQNQCKDCAIKEELKAATTDKMNKNISTATDTTITTTTTNDTNTKKTITTQQLTRSCVHAEDPSELKCC